MTATAPHAFTTDTPDQEPDVPTWPGWACTACLVLAVGLTWAMVIAGVRLLVTGHL